MSVKYSFEDHIVNRQYEAELEMLKEFEAGNYTIANPLVNITLILSIRYPQLYVSIQKRKQPSLLPCLARHPRAISATHSRRQRSTCFRL